MSDKLQILMLSIHGLMRGQRPELGRDADTGGQITYVLELARALGRRADVAGVDLITRSVEDPRVDADYARPEEPLGPGARIVRLPFGPRRYIRKELLWSHLPELVDRCLAWMRSQPRMPDVIHSHYADAGYVGRQLSELLGVPLVHTGHSLGRCKRQRLLDSGRRASAIDRDYQLPRRIDAEEETLAHASLVVTSTRQEASEQYGLYQAFRAARAAVIPPGTDTSRFSPPGREGADLRVAALVDRFLQRPEKPLILALCRPDPRKNLKRLVQAYGEDRELAEMANLAIVAGNRDDIRAMDGEQAEVLGDLLLDVDRHDLWGRVALPKHHEARDVPELYRLAARRRGVFINPALTEPFGLTLVEAAASGLPIVATQDGGPRDIIANCGNGLLVDPLDPAAIAAALRQALGDRRQWKRWSERGVVGVRRHYSWDGHVDLYLRQVRRVLHQERKRLRRERAQAGFAGRARIPAASHFLVSDVDNTLIGDAASLKELLRWLNENRRRVAFGIATGRNLDQALRALAEWGVPRPQLVISGVGSEIHYGPDYLPDQGWASHLSYRWNRDAVEAALAGLPGLELQAAENQSRFKLSFNVDPETMPPVAEISVLLRLKGLSARLILSHGAYLDALPVRASKGLAVRYLAHKWGAPLESFLVAGDSGNDTDMLTGDTLGVVVGNHSPELEHLRGRDNIHFAERGYAGGIIEGIQHYGFARVPAAPAQEQETAHA